MSDIRNMMRRLLACGFASYALAPSYHSLVTLTESVIGYHHGGIEKIIIVCLLYLAFTKIEKATPDIPQRAKKGIAFFSFVFAFCLLIGSYVDNENFHLLKNTDFQHLVPTASFVIGWVLLCYYSLKLLFIQLERKEYWQQVPERIQQKWGAWQIIRWYLERLKRSCYITTFISIISVWMIVLAMSYPGILHGDAVDSLCQMMPELPEWKSFSVAYCEVRQLSDNVKLNSHHPVLYTLIFSSIVKGAMFIFRSFSISLFIYNIIQILIYGSIISFCISTISKLFKHADLCAFFLILYYIAHPFVLSYIIISTKDVIYSGVFHLFLMSLFFLLMSKKNPVRRADLLPHSVLFYTSSLFLILLRNEAVYILVALGILSLLVSPILRKKVMALVLLCLIAQASLQQVYHACHITPGSVREMLTVPFQQTARYYLKHRDDLTQQEQDAVSSVLRDTDKLALHYSPGFSDPIKNKYIETASREDLQNYFIAWHSMLKKHPHTYIEATLSNIHRYFYPNSKEHTFLYSTDQAEQLVLPQLADGGGG